MKPGDLARVIEPSGRRVTGVWIDSKNHWRGVDVPSGSTAVLVEHDVIGSQARVLVDGQLVWIPREFVRPYEVG
jgi:hypothetical protein